ncbi:HAMP domain-containing sensor histidine kinase [Clostridium sp. 1001271B_151109_B4]|uniref:sensor histidine kinase n=1 Tax=Clostridium sp. 1001271B_151109_B4 TaxID=2787148 RepID=UPI0018A92DF6|nr:HAMP domain-containing sensor histidine kinase [Clostridium sp. 1001271B_151109_B4]
MGKVFIKEYTMDEKASKIISIFFMLALVMILFFVYKIFIAGNNKEYLSATLELLKLINSFLAIISIISCLILYRKTKKNTVFVLILEYIGLAIGIITDQFDYFTLINDEFYISDYIMISTSMLRMIILYILFFPKSKLYKFINENRAFLVIFLILYSFIVGVIEKYLTVTILNIPDSIYFYYNIFLFISYYIIAIKLVFISLKEKSVIIGCFGVSLALLGIKAIYAIYAHSGSYFDIMLTSILITYISFISVIIGTVIELYLFYEESKIVNIELEKFYNLAHYNSHTNMFICDNKLNISYMNNKIKESFSNDISNERFKEVILEIEDIKEKIPQISEELKKTGMWRGILTDVKRDEIIDCFIQLIHSSSDENRILVSYINISNNIRLESEIQAHKLNDIKKAEFISTLSHELKTPLNIFSSSVQLLDSFSDEDKEEFVYKYKKHSPALRLNCNRMLRLINNIIDLTKIDGGIVEANFGNYEMVSLIEDIALSIIPFGRSKNIDIEFDTNVEEHYMKCDPSMIEKIVLNLLSNAIKYSKNNGNIKINFILETDIVRFIVSDNGIGIAEEVRDKIFDRFSRGDNSLNRLNEGSGVGLNIVKSMVDIHNGNIIVESILGKGSTFEVQLPNIKIKDELDKIYEYSCGKTVLELSDIY